MRLRLYSGRAWVPPAPKGGANRLPQFLDLYLVPAEIRQLVVQVKELEKNDLLPLCGMQTGLLGSPGGRRRLRLLQQRPTTSISPNNDAPNDDMDGLRKGAHDLSSMERAIEAAEGAPPDSADACCLPPTLQSQRICTTNPVCQLSNSPHHHATTPHHHSSFIASLLHSHGAPPDSADACCLPPTLIIIHRQFPLCYTHM